MAQAQRSGFGARVRAPSRSPKFPNSATSAMTSGPEVVDFQDGLFMCDKQCCCCPDCFCQQLLTPCALAQLGQQCVMMKTAAGLVQAPSSNCPKAFCCTG